MSDLLDQLLSLYDAELYTNVITVCDLAVTAAEQNPDSFPLEKKLQLEIIFAGAMYHTRQFFNAENLYRQALQTRKSLKLKSTHATPATPNNKTSTTRELPTNIEIKYRISECCLAMKQKNAAIEILQQIPTRARTPKINMALADLYMESGAERSAITSYKDVLRECPLALHAVENLLKLGVKGVEVNALMVDAVADTTWLSLWLKAQALLHSREFAKALQAYKEMNCFGILKNNCLVLVNMGYCYYYLDQDEKAITVLRRALAYDENLMFGRDLLSTILANNTTSENISCIEEIISTLDMSLWSSEDWVVLGNYMYTTKKYEKAAYHAQQALLLNPKNFEALLLKARALADLGKHQDSIYQASEALKLCLYRYDLYHCLVENYIKLNRLREAESMAVNACKQLNYSPHSLTLHAYVLLKDPMMSLKTVKKILDRAISLDKTLQTNAVYMLVELLDRDRQYEQARQVFLKFIDDYPSTKMHQLMGDCYTRMEKDDAAFHHYNIALKLDPNNQKATEGLSNIGRSPTLSKRDSYYTCVVENSQASQVTSTSSQEVYAESDTDAWPANNSFQ